MTLVLRTTKGSPLTHAEVDANFVELRDSKYHQWTDGQYWFDSYTQSNNLRALLENQVSDLFRFQTLTSVEFWDYSLGTPAWVTWVGGAAAIQDIFDGRETGKIQIDHTHRKFRFTMSINAFPSQALLLMQTDWTGFGYPGATITMEEDPGTVWTVKANAIFTSANGINDWGHAVYATSALHTTESNIRVTVDINNWVDNGAYTTFPIKRLCLYSNYATTRPQAPFSWNYGRLFWTEGNLQAGQGFANNTLISGANAGSWPSIATQGSDANIGISLKYKGATAGTGLVVNNGNGNAVFKADGMTGTVVNNVVIRGSLTANDPDILVEGSDANIGLDVHTKGTGSFDVNTGGGLQFQIANTASAVNYFQATGGPSGTNPILTTQGSDASVSMRFTTKGAGDLNFAPGGIMAVQMPAITSGVNYWQLKPSVTTGAIQAVALGSDTNIAMQHVTKGTGSHLFNSGTGGLHFEIATPVTSVNYLQVKGSVTGVGPSITALGSDANIDINATPKGAGKFVCSGDITAFSDPKLKTNWMGLGEDFLAKLRKVQYGTFDRIDTGQRQAGINAAHMKEALPEVVPDGNILSVNYGAAAMVTALELLHKIDALEKRIRELEAK